jgi:regulator of sirC expression with transglutaminase-like and TPR domain
MVAIEGLDKEASRAPLELVQAWGNEARHLVSRRGRHLALDTLRQILVDEAGFKGDREDYHAPQNSLLSDVLLRRRGLPIVLSALWMEVGRRAGIAVEGVGMPGHFIVRVESQLCDPFDSGRSLTREDCARIVSELSGGKLPLSESMLKANTTSQILERILRNLVKSYVRSESSLELYRSVRLLASLNPSPANLLSHGRVAEKSGAFTLALQTYEGLLARHPSCMEARLARQLIRPLKKRVSRLN